MSEFKVKNSLAVHTFIYSTIKKIEMKVKEIPMWESKKGDNEILKSACLFIIEELERAVNDKEAPVQLKAKQANTIDKTKIVMQSLANIFDLTDEEQATIESNVEFILNNKIIVDKQFRQSIIKKVSKKFNKLFFWKK